MADFGFRDALANIYFHEGRFYLTLHEDIVEGFDSEEAVVALRRINQINARQAERLGPVDWEHYLCSEILHESNWTVTPSEPFTTHDPLVAQRGLQRVVRGLKALRQQAPTLNECVAAVTAGMTAHA